jgi:hypothetical protein
MQQNSKRLGRCLVSLIVVAGFAGAAFAQESGATDQEEINQQSDAMDLDEINRQLNNPIASIWSLALRDTYSILDGDAVESSTYSNLLNFQPVLPIPIGEKLILINLYLSHSLQRCAGERQVPGRPRGLGALHEQEVGRWNVGAAVVVLRRGR